jgi:hypothetical protein
MGRACELLDEEQQQATDAAPNASTQPKVEVPAEMAEGVRALEGKGLETAAALELMKIAGGSLEAALEM